MEQEILENKFSISWPLYLRGKYDGLLLSKLVHEVKDIFEKIKDHLLVITDRCSNEEVLQIYNNFSLLLLCVGCLFSLLHTEFPLLLNHCKPIEDTILSIKQKYIVLGIWITPKSYCIFDHLLQILEKHDGSIAQYAEDFIEQGHQTGVKEESRLLNIKSKIKKAEYHLQWEFERNIPDVYLKQKEVNNCTKRKFKHEKETKTQARKKEVILMQSSAVANKLEKQMLLKKFHTMINKNQKQYLK